jgi:hypothetical protein
MFRATAYYGRLAVSTVITAEDIEAATINAELAYVQADMIVVEGL